MRFRLEEKSNSSTKLGKRITNAETQAVEYVMHSSREYIRGNLENRSEKHLRGRKMFISVRPDEPSGKRYDKEDTLIDGACWRIAP